MLNQKNKNFEFSRLRKSDLLELLIEESKKNEALEQRLKNNETLGTPPIRQNDPVPQFPDREPISTMVESETPAQQHIGRDSSVERSNTAVKTVLQSRSHHEKSGPDIGESFLRLNRMFEAADAACAEYKNCLKGICEEQARLNAALENRIRLLNTPPVEKKVQPLKLKRQLKTNVLPVRNRKRRPQQLKIVKYGG